MAEQDGDTSTLNCLYCENTKVTFDKEPTDEMAYGQLWEMAVTYKTWKKWHYMRSFSTTRCGRYIDVEAYLIHREMLGDDELCMVCDERFSDYRE